MPRKSHTRYGILYIVTASSPSIVGTRILQNFNKLLALKLKDSYSYGDALITRPYMDYRSSKHAKKMFALLKRIWNNKEIQQ